MNLAARLPKLGPRNRRRAFIVLASAAILSGVTLAAMTVQASPSVAVSAFAPADRLLEHGIVLSPVPGTYAAAIVSADSAKATAVKAVSAPADPDETYRVLASATYYAPKQTAWLFLFKGGSDPVSVGPAEGADSRTFTTDFTGVLVDDQTGQVLRWFQSWHFTP